MEAFGRVLASAIERIDEVANRNENRPRLQAASPIEVELDYHNLSKFVDDRVRIHWQYPVKTTCGVRVIDFVLEGAGVRIGLECDGRDFHVYERDRWRDAVILGTGAIDAIYRFSGTMITHHPHDCVYIVANNDPLMISDRGRLILPTLASSEVISASMDRGSCWVQYEPSESGREMSEVVQRRKLALPKFFARWRFAKASGLADLDEIIARAHGDRLWGSGR